MGSVDWDLITKLSLIQMHRVDTIICFSPLVDNLHKHLYFCVRPLNSLFFFQCPLLASSGEFEGWLSLVELEMRSGELQRPLALHCFSQSDACLLRSFLLEACSNRFYSPLVPSGYRILFVFIYAVRVSNSALNGPACRTFICHR